MKKLGGMHGIVFTIGTQGTSQDIVIVASVELYFDNWLQRLEVSFIFYFLFLGVVSDDVIRGTVWPMEH